MPYYFTRAGAERIQRQKEELVQRLQSMQRQQGEAAEVGGNVWHDNFAFEQLKRDEQMVNQQIAALNQKMQGMIVVDQVSPDTRRLRIGHIAVLDVDGREQIFRVGGFEDSDLEVDPPIASYLAPVIAPFIGEAPGYVASIELGGNPCSATLMEVRLVKTEGGTW